MLIRKPNTLDGDERAVLLISCDDDPPNAPGCCGLREISNAKTSKAPAVTEQKFVSLTKEHHGHAAPGRFLFSAEQVVQHSAHHPGKS